MPTETILQLDPTLILADDNARYGLKETAIDRLAADILESGGVHTPVEVVDLPGVTEGGHVYGLTYGYYRHAAVLRLIAEGVPMLLPAIVRPAQDASVRLQTQLSENVARENLSPMDMAVAIDKLIAAGVSKTRIREVFARPTGKKSLTLEPASNAWVNMVRSLLQLPKPIRERIHDGRIGLGGAYQLTRVSPDRREALVARIEAARLEELEAEEREEAKLTDAAVRAVRALADDPSPAAPGKVQGTATAPPKLKAKAKPKAKAIGAAEVKKAARASGDAKAGLIPLTRTEMVEVLAGMERIMPEHSLLGETIRAIQKCFSGEMAVREFVKLMESASHPRAEPKRQKAPKRAKPAKRSRGGK